MDEIEALLIDVLSTPFTVFNNKNSKALFTLLGLVEKAEKIAINLANRSFSHFLITIGNVFYNHINSTNVAYDTINKNLFAYIAIDQYLSDKFYRIMIDTSIFKYFTAGYEQFMAYRRDIKYTTINISKADTIYV